MKRVIGIVPKAQRFQQNTTNFDDVYYLGNNYIKRIEETGMIPVCLAPNDGWLSEDALALCDGFVAQGGKCMQPYHFQVVHHAFTQGKKYLGICLGMQLLHRYLCMRRYVLEHEIPGDLCKNIIDILESKGAVAGKLESIEGHRSAQMPRGEEDAAKHDVDIVPGTLLHQLMGANTMRGATYHNWRVVELCEDETVNAWSTDGTGTVEGIECGPNLLGVQFHPEVDDRLPELFRFLSK